MTTKRRCQYVLLFLKEIRRYALLSFIFLCVFTPQSMAEPTRPGKDCKIQPSSTWNDTEQWIWKEVCEGRIADLNAHFNQFPDPVSPNNWTKERRLSANFLETILLSNPWRSSIGRGGVAIIGAWFPEKIDLANARLEHDLTLNYSRMSGVVDLSALHAEGSIVLHGSAFSSWLILANARIANDLWLNDTNLNSLSLVSLNVGREIRFTNARIDGDAWLEHLQVNQSLFLRHSTFNGYITLASGKVGLNLDLNESNLSHFDLTSTTVLGDLRLGPNWHEDNDGLILRDASVKTLYDEPTSWPAKVDLEGFTYQRLGGSFSGQRQVPWNRGEISDPLDRGIGWYRNLLAQTHPFSPQPYKQLSQVLREMGHRSESEDIQYFGRERERDISWQEGKYAFWLGQTMLKFAIGYGYGDRYFYCLFWIGALTIIGTIVLYLSNDSDRIIEQNKFQASFLSNINKWASLCAYSFDILLPLVELRKQHYTIDLDGVARYYFYLHKITGYILGSFLIAGLAGLTQ